MKIVILGRDTCNGTCETQPGCDCLRYHPAEASTSIGADQPAKPGQRAPLPNSVDRWARVLLGFIVCVIAAIGAGALVGFLTR